MQEPNIKKLSDLTENLAHHGIRPIRDQVLVRQDPKKERFANGLYAPDVASRELQDDLGTVVAVGPGALVDGVRIPLLVGPEDRVMFRRRPDSALIPDPREGGRPEWRDLVLLRESDIIAVIEDS